MDASRSSKGHGDAEDIAQISASLSTKAPCHTRSVREALLPPESMLITTDYKGCTL